MLGKHVPGLFDAHPKTQEETEPQMDTLPPRNPTRERSPAVDRILVRQSSMRALELDPGALVADAVACIAYFTRGAGLSRGDLPDAAFEIFYTELYRRQVSDHGHAEFIARAEHDLPRILADIGWALQEAGAEQHLGIFDAMRGWIEVNPDEASDLTGEEDDIPDLANLDRQLRNLEAGRVLQPALAGWISTLDCLEVVADAEWFAALRSALPSDPRSVERFEHGSIAEIQGFLSNPAHVGFGMATAGVVPPEPVLRLGGAQRLDGAPMGQDKARRIRTTAGLRFGLHEDGDFILYEAVPTEHPESGHPVEMATRQEMRHDRIDDFFSRHPHKLGREVARVPFTRVKDTIVQSRGLGAARAIFRLLESLPQPANATAVSVHRSGSRRDGSPELVVLIAADAARRAFSAIIVPEGARLLSEPGHEELVALSRAEIDRGQDSSDNL